VLLIITDAIKMLESFDAGSIVTAGGIFAKVMNDGTGGTEGLEMGIEAEASEFSDAELFAEKTLGVVAVEDPVFEAGFHTASAVEKRVFGGFKKLLRARKKSFAGMEELEFVAKIVFGARALEFSGEKFSGGKVDEGEADVVAVAAGSVLGNGGEEIIFAGVEDGNVGGGAGGDDARNFAAHEFLAGAGLLHLFADGDFEAGADKAGDVTVSGVIRDAAHGDGLALFAIAGSEGDAEFASGDDGVFVEEFVEVTETEEQQGMRVASLHGVVLLHQGCGGFGHEKS